MVHCGQRPATLGLPRRPPYKHCFGADVRGSRPDPGGPIGVRALTPTGCAAPRPLTHGTSPRPGEVVAIKLGNKNYNVNFGIFDHCLAKLGPETRSNGSGSTNGAGSS
jgi:hypothetical protein